MFSQGISSVVLYDYLCVLSAIHLHFGKEKRIVGT
jgi:hypothetical protein